MGYPAYSYEPYGNNVPPANGLGQYLNQWGQYLTNNDQNYAYGPYR
jgi:hypothetical protein